MTDSQLTEPEQVARSRASQANLSDLGRRRINLIWERTQAVIAISVVVTTLATASYLVVTFPSATAPFTLLASLANLVIGFYFGRTNHSRVGGTGPDEIGR